MKTYLDSLESLSRQQLILMLARQHLQRSEGLAIVGMACRFPGGISDPGTFWEALCSARQVPEEGRGMPVDSTGWPRWDPAAGDLAPMADLFGKGVYLDDVDLFAADRFGISDEEALYMDPQQRVLLTVAAQALDDAGGLRDREQRVGVFAGVSTVEYHFAHLRNGLRVDRLSPYMGTGAALSGTAARVALGLRLNGPVMTVDTACSSALTAVHLASTSLRLGECDMAIVGACHLQLAPFTTAVFNEAKMLSPTGRSLPFTAKADGHVRSEGCGALVLKRLRDAKADGDKPYAIIRGASVHQQGDRATMTAMPAAGLRRVMVEALRRAEIDAFDVRFVEAQANGSKLSGAIEVEATADAYRRAAPGAPPLYLGSCKANLGYMETASGAASLMKAALLLRHAQIPPQPGSGALDPDIRWDRFTIAVPQVLTPWPAGPRRLAGVSSFGFTGTNAHVILEAAADAGARPPYPGPGTPGRRYWPDTHNWT